ncbi:MAG: hypothetical protein LBQ34_00380 [Alphaproteobacteria bacterium]|jgi:hypothetical protein|nr:hypothetical protein [Alphaproteobacteria bacterium]
MKKLMGILLIALMLSPSFLSAKMIKLENYWVNESAITLLSPTKNGNCEITHSYGGNVKRVDVEMSCDAFIKEKGIDSK